MSNADAGNFRKLKAAILAGLEELFDEFPRPDDAPLHRTGEFAAQRWTDPNLEMVTAVDGTPCDGVSAPKPPYFFVKKMGCYIELLLLVGVI